MFRLVVVCCCVLNLPVSFRAQEFAFRNYNVKEGLPSAETYDVIQDSKGYIWIATDAGVSRFNGDFFENFDSGNGLPDNTIFGIYEDYKGRIWFRGLTGILSYYYEGKIHVVSDKGTTYGMDVAEVILSMYVDSNDVLWIGSSLAEYRIEWGENQFIVNKKSYANGYFIHCFGDGNLIFGRDAKYITPVNFTVDNNGQTFSYRLQLKKEEIVPVSECVRAGDGTFYFSFGKYVLHLNARGEMIEQVRRDKVNICLFRDKKNKIWIGSRKKGVDLLSTDKTIQVVNSLLSGLSVAGMCQDHEGGYWFATHDEGVFYLPNLQFVHYPLSLAESGSVWFTATTNDDVIALATNGKLYSCKYDSISQLAAELQPDDYPLTAFALHDTIVFGARSGFHYSIPPYTTTRKARIVAENFFSIARNKRGSLWLANHAGIYRWYPDRKNKLIFYPAPERSTVVFVEENDNVWVGTIGGLYKFKDGKYLHADKNNKTLKQRIDDIAQLPSGELVLASRGGGVIFFSPDTVYSLTTKQGISSNICRNICIEPNGVIWAGTNKGLSRIEKRGKDFSIVNYSENNGLLSNNANNLLLQDSLLWIGSGKGISILNIRRLVDTLVRIPMHITGIRVTDTSYNLDAFPEHFPYNKNYFTFSFIGLTYLHHSALTYGYRMDGVDTTWRTTSLTSVQYPTLPPGEYKFSVCPFIEGKPVTSSIESVSFTIIPPFWKTWWAITSEIILSAGMIGAVINLRYRYIRKKERQTTEVKQKMAQIELKALRAQINPHFLFNCMGTIQNFILTDRNRDAELYLQKFSRLLRGVLQLSEETFITLSDELEYLKLYIEVESIRFSENFNYRIIIDDSIDADSIKVPSLLLQPFVENSIWHGLRPSEGLKQIEIIVSQQEEGIKISIKDNGIGRKAAEELKQERRQQSMGIRLGMDRMEMLSVQTGKKFGIHITDINIVTGNTESGTIIDLFIPEIIHHDKNADY